MRCIPEQRRMILVNVLIALTVTLGLVLFAASVIFRESGNNTARFWLQPLATVSIVTGIFVFARYRIMKFAYVIRHREEWDNTGLFASYSSIDQIPFYMLDFAVYKTVGMREPVAQCVLSLENFKGMTPAADRKTFEKEFVRENGAGFTVYDYTLTPWSRDGILLVFLLEDKQDKYVGILIEPDEQMRAFFEAIN